MLLDQENIAKAADHLSRVDPVMAPVIARAGLCTIRPHTDYYQTLVQSIVGQQLSVKAAASIRKRFLELYDNVFPTPQQILETSIEDMRACGFSRAKATYVQDLAQHILDGKLDFDRFDKLSNQEIILELVAIKGVGEWTAHMFLMFCIGRSDILPYGDLGIRNGAKQLYGLATMPDRAQLEAIAAEHHWQPYESVAAWYIWQSLDNAPE